MQKSLKTNAILNMIRRGSAILFPVITFSYASHKLGASGIGAFSFCNSVISYFLLLAALGISTYAVREGQAVRDDIRELTKFVSEVYTINIISTIISYVLLGLLVVIWSKLHGYREILFLLSVSIAMTTIGADWVNTLMEDYLYIALQFIGVQIFCLVMLIILVKGPEDIYKYALISALASIGGNLFNVWYIRRRVHLHITTKPNIKKHIAPMITLFSNSLAIRIYLIADVTILGIFMSDQYVGYYSVASKVYTSIKEMINAMIIVTVPRFSYYLSHGEIEKYKNSFNEVKNAVITLMFPCIAGLLFQAENVVYYLGGAEYVAGAASLRVLSIAMFFAVGACLVSQSIMIPYKMEKYYLSATIVSAIMNILLNVLLIPRWGIEAAAVTTLISEAIVFVIMIYRCRPVFPKTTYKTGDLLSTLAGVIGISAVCLMTNMKIDNRLINMVISVIVSALVYFAITYLMNNQTIRKAIIRTK